MTSISCPACGKQYTYSPQLSGKNVRCQSCGHTFLVRLDANNAGGLEIIDAPLAVGGTSGGKRCDAIDYEIFGNEMQFCEVTLDPGEMVTAEAGSMMYMTAGIRWKRSSAIPAKRARASSAK
jgi:hypothetical protein